jgi:hypothetical protein
VVVQREASEQRERHDKDDLLQRIATFYLRSSDFNGLSLHCVDLPPEQLARRVIELVRENLVSLEFGDIHPHPHIKALEPAPLEVQLDKITRLPLANACAYPTPAHLARVVDQAPYADRPFTLKLHLGEPQLRPYFFDLTILEFYRNDPRYHYKVNDVGGQISVTTEHYLGGQMADADKVVLETFGFAYDAELNRAVAAYLRYLHRLSPEHQRSWQAKLLVDEYKLHPDYWRTTHGHWGGGVSIFAAFLEEMHQINKIARLIGRPRFFHREYRAEERPREFTFLIRPTLREFNGFVHLLDKMVSDNINFDFFGRDVPVEEERERSDGRIEVVKKGSLRGLDEWLNRSVRLDDASAVEDILSTFKKIRALRQRPAHAIEEDVFDQQYFKKQREVIIEANSALQTLRLILALHPAAQAYVVPNRLASGKIWTY